MLNWLKEIQVSELDFITTSTFQHAFKSDQLADNRIKIPRAGKAVICGCISYVFLLPLT